MSNGHRRIRPVARVATLTLVALIAPQAKADFSIGTAVNYGVLAEPGVKSFQLNNSTVNGNVGIGAGLGSGGVQIASNGFIKPGGGTPGQLDLVDSSATVSNPGNVAGGVHFSQSQVTTAINTVNSLGTMLGAEAGTALTISGAGQVVNASSGMLDGGGNRVFTVAANGFNNNSAGFTINGAATDFVVININNGTSNESLGGPLTLTGGITSDHVLLNFTGTSGNLGSGSTNGAVLNGIILAPNMLVNLDNVTIDGRLFGGRAGTDFQIVSGFNLNQPQSVPEPASLTIFGIGVAFLGSIKAMRRSRRKSSESAAA
jgi:hypothetical protein